MTRSSTATSPVTRSSPGSPAGRRSTWRGETDTEEKIQRRVEFDLYYIENWSVFFDFYIVAMTPFALVKSENAY